VKGLLAKPGQTLVVEQPELHLNPALQVRLADFLVAMVCAGKQVLIETHSEHIVDAIRVLYVEDETGQLENKCRIFFIDTELDKPSVLQLDIKKDGTVPDWPQHFFGEAASLTGRLLRAQKKFRKKSRTT
jgi:predicted ATPase